ncbi:TetR/AcrR family transcriptional regulator [Mycoplasma sp. P36-A1]|uniref:TetR/AcrR family transcriptional regulator n=1 Tax=Mycoplasma sp. P36-A1 TaxID=3252900 RepID=UPI003C2AEC96
MKKTTRDIILEKGIKLLKKEGYNNLSMRDIAKEANISVGNLTYYYKTKEEILLAFIEKDEDKIIKFKNPTTMLELDNLFTTIAYNLSTHLYEFNSYDRLKEEYPILYTKANERLDKLKELFKHSLNNLCNNKELKKIPNPNVIDNIVSVLVAISVYKIPFDKDNEESYSEKVRFCLWSIIYPYLTLSGWEQYKKINQENI